MNVFNSSAYARQNGKPVFGIRGLGFTQDRYVYGTPENTTKLIQQLKSQGFYVIGVVPTYWREEINDSRKNFRQVYLSLDMLQPYNVGKFGSVIAAKEYAKVLKEDYELLKQHNIEFQPMVFPGMSRFNGYSDYPKNEIPRMYGRFMWQQFNNIRSLGIKSVSVHKFNGFRDGTVISKVAEDVSMIPVNSSQTFLTLDADGVPVSSDFYLRLVADGKRLIQGEIELQREPPTKPFV